MKPPITEILEYARRAPSVHNTQPWCFVVDNDTISLMVKPERALDAGDPTRRELWVSLGICFETILQAASGLGFEATILSIQTDTASGEIARIHFTPGKTAQPDILKLIEDRHTYRGPMKPAVIPASLIETCRHAIKDLPDVSIITVSDRESIAKIAKIADQGMRLALSSSKFRKELAPLLNYNWSRARTGLHGYVLNHGIIGSIWEKWSVILGVDSKRKGRADQHKVLESSELLFLLSTGDVPSFWLNIGRAYMRVALEITKAGLAHSTITAPVEAARFHEDVENLLHTTDRIQSMIRIGEATQPGGRRSPRLSLDELTT